MGNGDGMSDFSHPLGAVRDWAAIKHWNIYQTNIPNVESVQAFRVRNRS